MIEEAWWQKPESAFAGAADLSQIECRPSELVAFRDYDPRSRGELKRYAKTGSSGAQIVTAYCGDCGSPIFSQKGDAPKYVKDRVGGVRQRTDLQEIVRKLTLCALDVRQNQFRSILN